MILTKDNKVLAVTELSWNEVINKLKKITPAIATIMKKLNVNKNAYTFYLASYPYGSKIINDKKAYLPLESGDVIAFDDLRLPDSLYNNLNYNPAIEDPIGIILSKTSEFYLLGEERIQPHSTVAPGQLFGIPRAIDNSPNTSSVLEANLNAGCRSIFMLSKISDQTNHSKLQEKYGIKSEAPSTPQEHWEIFVDLAKQANSAWRTEILFLPRNWINNVITPEWAALEISLMHMHRKSYSIWHKMSDIWNKAWHEIEQEKQLNKYYPMQSLETAKHLFKMAADIMPGFRPSINDESAPISLLTEAYLTTYNKLAKQKYNPIIMEPAKFGMQNHRVPLYYSINYASFTQNHLDSSKKKSQIALLEEIRIITELYCKGILENKNRIPSLYDIAKNIIFTYYHTNPENYPKIKNATLLTSDPGFSQVKDNEFPNTAPFLKGCIKISLANNNYTYS